MRLASLLLAGLLAAVAPLELAASEDRVRRVDAASEMLGLGTMDGRIDIEESDAVVRLFGEALQRRFGMRRRALREGLFRETAAGFEPTPLADRAYGYLIGEGDFRVAVWQKLDRGDERDRVLAQAVLRYSGHASVALDGALDRATAEAALAYVSAPKGVGDFVFRKLKRPDGSRYPYEISSAALERGMREGYVPLRRAAFDDEAWREAARADAHRTLAALLIDEDRFARYDAYLRKQRHRRAARFFRQMLEKGGFPGDPPVDLPADITEYPWERLPHGERRRIAALDAVAGRPQLRSAGIAMDRARLPFYEDAWLIRARGTWQPVGAALYFLSDGKGTLHWLNGTSPPIHAFNETHEPVLNAATAKPYLWFFTFFVRGDEGPFLLAQNAADTFMPAPRRGAMDAATYRALTTLPEAATCKAAARGRFRCTATLFYSNAFFGADFEIVPGGMVEMPEDRPLAAGLSVKVDAPITVATRKAAVAAKTVTRPAARPAPPRPETPKVDDLSRRGTVPPSQRGTVETLSEGRQIVLDRANTPFLSGLAMALVKKCAVPSSLADRAKLIAFGGSGMTGALFGTDFSNPDLGDSIGNMMGTNLMMAAGGELGERIPCEAGIADAVASNILRAVRANEGRDAGGSAPFVASCSRRHGETACECVAGVARGTMPDIYRRQYSGQLMKQVIERNPLAGFLIIACGVTQY